MPYLTKVQIEEIATRVVKAYLHLPCHEGSPVRKIDPATLAQELLGLTVLYRRLATKDNILGLTSSGEVEIGVIGDDGKFEYQWIDGKTIVVNSLMLEEGVVVGHLNFTLMHETCHQIFKMLFPKAYAAEASQGTIHYCRRRPRRTHGDWEEWRTDTLTAAILMPAELVMRYMQEYGFGNRIKMLNRVYAKPEYELFSDMADALGVSKTALAIRLKELMLIERDYFDDPFRLVNVEVDDDWLKEEEDYAKMRCKNYKS